jgi:L-seryl-tRNA(Ser) seleniumtransferase
MPANANPYLALGVRPFINCCSVRTMHGGSLMLPQVCSAMAEAARHFVNLDELMEAAGARLAELTGAEWGIVTCGSAAAVALGTAACVAGNDPVRMLRLPFTDGMPNRVIIPKNQRFAYDIAIRMVGTHLVEVETRADLDQALAAGGVAMVAILGKSEHLSVLRLEEIVAAVRPRGIPVLVDAASEHLERPSPWLARGADLVVYSGGKFLRGPQTSGLLLGDKRLCQAAWRNASPHQALGRPMKVSKEDIVGVLTALDYWFGERDEAAERQRWYDDLDTIRSRVARLAGAGGEIVEPGGQDRVPRLRVFWDADRYPLDGLGLRRRLLDGEPRIMLDDNSAAENSLAVDPFQLQPGEAATVGDAIARALGGVGRTADVAPAPAVSIAGDWELRVDFLKGARLHRVTIEQQGAALTGRQSSAQFEGPVAGHVAADRIVFHFDGRFEGSRIMYRFDGTVANGHMAGTVALGAATDTSPGPVNLSQFGTGQWQARRVA